MNKAEKFISDHTRKLTQYGNDYFLWVTLDDARKAVEIAKKEIYEWLKDNIHMYNGECEGDRKAIIEDLKQAIKDE